MLTASQDASIHEAREPKETEMDAAQRSARIAGGALPRHRSSRRSLRWPPSNRSSTIPKGYIAGGGHDTRIYLAALLELLLMVVNIGTAVVPLLTLRRENESLALGYVTARIMESMFIAIGILAVLAGVTLRKSAFQVISADLSRGAEAERVSRRGS